MTIKFNTVGLVYCNIEVNIDTSIHTVLNLFQVYVVIIIDSILCTLPMQLMSHYLHMHVNSRLAGLDPRLTFETQYAKERVEPMA